MVAPDLLHLVRRSLALAVPFARVGVALLFACEWRRFLLTAAGAVAWASIGFLAGATWFPEGDARRWYAEMVYFQQAGKQTPSAPLPPSSEQQPDQNTQTAPAMVRNPKVV